MNAREVVAETIWNRILGASEDEADFAAKAVLAALRDVGYVVVPQQAVERLLSDVIQDVPGLAGRDTGDQL